MTTLQLLIIMNHSRRIIDLLRVIVYLLDIFGTGPNPTQPTQDREFCDPTRPNPTRLMSNSEPD